MMKKILFPLYLAAGSILYAQTSIVPNECKMHIDKVKNGTTQFTLTISHDEKCEIMLDHHTSKIVLISKEYTPGEVHQTKVIDKEGTESKADTLIKLAKSKLGNSYVPVKAGPDHFDCSGFVYYLFTTNGISVPRTSLDQSKSGKKLTRK